MFWMSVFFGMHVDCDNRTRHAVMKENISWSDRVL